MTESNERDELKNEIKRELEKEIESEITEEVEEAMTEQRVAAKTVGLFKSYFFAVAATIIALGQFSEAVTLIDDGIDWLRSKFTNSVEYDLLAHIKVGNSAAYIAELLGSPQVTRSVDDQITANYFYNDKFLLTILSADERVVAFTVIPLVEGFRPNIPAASDRAFNLGEFSYSSFPGNPESYLVDHSKVISYYLEILDVGRTGLFFKVYLGNVVLTGDGVEDHVVAMYNKEVMGSDSEIATAQTSLRQQLKPNFFGMGNVGLEPIQKSILTAAEFASYFGK